MNKSTIIFLASMIVTATAFAFFNQMMSMPQQVMQGSMQMINPQQTCDCKCPQPQ